MENFRPVIRKTNRRDIYRGGFFLAASLLRIPDGLFMISEAALLSLNKKEVLVREKYYVSLERNPDTGELTSHQGFKHPKDLGVPVYAPDWNPDPNIYCGCGMHFVSEHPLLTARFVPREHPAYFEIEPIGEIVPGTHENFKFRACGYKRIREITKKSPEMRQSLLCAMFFSEKHVHERTILLKNISCTRCLHAIAMKHDDTFFRLSAAQKINNQFILAHIVWKNPNQIVRDNTKKKLNRFGKMVLATLLFLSRFGKKPKPIPKSPFGNT